MSPVTIHSDGLVSCEADSPDYNSHKTVDWFTNLSRLHHKAENTFVVKGNHFRKNSDQLFFSKKYLDHRLSVLA